MAALWLWLPPSSSSAAFRWMERSLEPDDVAGMLISGARPPGVVDLLIEFAPAAYVPDDEGDGRDGGERRDDRDPDDHEVPR